jgi:phosphate transport system substrate-binding protein
VKRLRKPLLAVLAVTCWSAGPAAVAQETELRVGGTGTTLGTIALLGKAFEQANPGLKINVLSSLGSTGGIKAVLGGAIAIGLSARPLTEIESRQGAVAREYGRSPLAMTVARSNPIAGITKAQLVDIYAGKMQQWPNGEPIRLVMRPETEISTVVLKTISPQMREAVTAAGKRPGMLFALTDQETTESISKIPGALGPTALCEIITANPQLKPLALDGVEPSPANIANGSYPVYHRFYLVTGAKPSAQAERFIAFIYSDAGKKILTGSGHWVPDQPDTR